MPKKLQFSNLDKILFPKSKITKGDLIEYYSRIAFLMVKYTKNRPLSMHRFPDGINHKGFFQKNADSYFPDFIKTIKIVKTTNPSEYTNYVLCQNKSTLLYLANLACIEFHLWLSTTKNLANPDKLIFDLDPSEDNFDNVIFAAKTIKAWLENKNLVSFVMTTGSRGLHVVVPLKAKHDFDQVKQFAQVCAKELVHEYSDRLTLEFSKEKRDGKLFIDTLRNEYTATSISPYSTRAHEKAPVATPLYWHELDNKNLNSQTYNIDNIFDRILNITDPWSEMKKYASILPI